MVEPQLIPRLVVWSVLYQSCLWRVNEDKTTFNNVQNLLSIYSINLYKIISRHHVKSSYISSSSCTWRLFIVTSRFPRSFTSVFNFVLPQTKSLIIIVTAYYCSFLLQIRFALAGKSIFLLPFIRKLWCISYLQKLRLFILEKSRCPLIWALLLRAILL